MSRFSWGQWLMLRPEDLAKVQHAAITGCVGTGDWLVDLQWRWTDKHGWRLWTDYGACLKSNGLREPSGCTADTAVREGERRG